MKLFRKISVAFASTVVSLTTNPLLVSANEDVLNGLLLEKAIPLDEYEQLVVASGGEPFIQDLGRDLGENNNDDGAYFSYDNMLTFNGYALKYATCQKVQRYSVEAVQNGEYSSMVTDNIVILRLCPKTSCSTSSQWGCNSGFGEYAIDVSDYMSIVMRYLQHKEENFCSFCQDCSSESSYSDYGDDNYNASSSNSKFYKYSANGQLQIYDANTCYTYSNMCKEVGDSCNSYYDDDNQNATSSGSTTNYLAHLDYFGCAKINGYWVSPQCDTKQNTINMGIYYDNACNQDASSSVDVTNFLDEDFDTNIFSYATDIGCIDCQTSKYPPYYNAHNFFCSNVYYYSGKCDNYLEYDLMYKYTVDDTYGNSASQVDDYTQCTFIESIRYGTYDAYGDIYTNMMQTSISEGTVTPGQKTSLITLSLVSGGLAIYSCILHHRMTSLLLESLRSGLVGSGKKRWATRTNKKSKSDDYSEYTDDDQTYASQSTYGGYA